MYHSWMLSFRSSIIFKAFDLLTYRDRSKLSLIILAQIILALLDLIGVALVGVIGSLSITGIQSNQPGDRVTKFLEMFSLDGFVLREQIVIISISAAVFFIGKTLLSILFLKRSLIFLGIRSAQFSGELISKIIKKDFTFLTGKSKQEIIFNLTGGTNSIFLGILGSCITIVSDLSLIIVMVIGLFYIDFGIAFGSITFFTIIGFSLHIKSSKKAKFYGIEGTKLTVRVNNLISNLIDTFRELYIQGNIQKFSNEIKKTRLRLAKINSEISYIPYVNKYILEISVIIGVVLLSFTQIISQAPSRAIGNLTLFLAAATRVVPSILRLQQSVFQVKLSIGGAIPTLDLHKELLQDLNMLDSPQQKGNSTVIDFNARVVFNKVCYKFPNNMDYAIKDFSAVIESGTLVAIVGKSGSGKSTLVNLMLGVLQPTSGSITISGATPRAIVQDWPGYISYVPQNVEILNTSVVNNVALAAEIEGIFDEERIWGSLHTAQLDTYVKDLAGDLHSLVGEKGAKLSGGEQQRLGIARALYTDPRLLILDEATSALDSITELALNSALMKLKGDVTLVVVAHRLSTIQSADLVLYIDAGKLAASGSFEEVRRQIPNFDKQAKIMGI
jgi:ABC-type bacteriocin/lantibiotic exporter with double-glycine peptidase domain